MLNAKAIFLLTHLNLIKLKSILLRFNDIYIIHKYAMKYYPIIN